MARERLTAAQERDIAAMWARGAPLSFICQVYDVPGTLVLAVVDRVGGGRRGSQDVDRRASGDA